MKTIESIEEIRSYSKRKLIYLCNQWNIPFPMNPTREILIESIESFRENNQTKIANPPVNESVERKSPRQNDCMHTPKVSNSVKNQNLPTPVTVYADSDSSCSPHRHIRSPSTSPQYFSTKNAIFWMNNDAIGYFFIAMLISFVILLLMYLFLC